MKKNTSTPLSLFVIALLVLVPVLQTLPLPLPSLLPEAHAQGYINLSNHNSNKTNATSAPYQITLSSFSVGTAGNRLLVVGVEANNQPVSSCWPNNDPWNTTATYLNSTLGNLTHLYK